MKDLLYSLKNQIIQYTIGNESRNGIAKSSSCFTKFENKRWLSPFILRLG